MIRKLPRLAVSMIAFAAVPALQSRANPGTAVYFANGACNTRKTSEDYTKLLRQGLLPRLPPEALPLSSGVAFHQTLSGAPLGATCTGDLLQGLVQSHLMEPSQFWRYQAGLDPWPDWLRTSFLDIASAFDAAAVVVSPEVQEHVDAYRLSIKRDAQKVVVVGSSQGNFFANIEFTQLAPDEQESFGIIAVGSEAGFVASNGRRPQNDLYSLNRWDLIAPALAIQLGITPMPWNVENPITLEDPTGHFFEPTYMREGTPSREKILSDTVALIGALADPAVTPGRELLSNGSFTDPINTSFGDWTTSGDFWVGADLPNWRTPPGYAAGGTDANGFHKNSASGALSRFVLLGDNLLSARLSFWLNVTSNDLTGVGHDTLDVQVQTGPTVVTLDTFDNRQRGALGAYERYEYDLLPDASGLILLTFRARTDASLTTVFRIDDVSIVVQP